MPFALVFIGLIMIVTGARNTHAALGQQLQSDFTGQGNFVTWVVAIGAVGSVGYVDKLKTLSNAFMVLILIAMILSNRGFFSQFSAALAKGPVAPAAAPAATPSTIDHPPIDTLSPEQAGTLYGTNQSGAFGQPADTAGQAKANGWINYFIGGSWIK